MNKRMITIGFLSMAAISVHAGDEFYKWVDDKGVTHYSQSTPENMTKDRKVETVNVRTHIPVDAADAIANLDKQRQDAQRARVEADAAAGKAKARDKLQEEASAKAKDLNKANCSQWQMEVDQLSSHGRVRQMDEGGESHVMTDEEKQKRLEQSQKNLKQYCGS